MMDYLVIGGGYFGCSIGYHLAKTGASVLLLEEKEIAAGASGANFGCVQVQDATMGVSLAMTLEGIQRMAAAGEELGKDIGYSAMGSMVVAENEIQLHELRKVYEEKKAAGLDIRWMEPKELEAAEPNVAPGTLLGATWYKQGRIWPFAYLYALLAQGKEAGMIVREHTKVSRLAMQGDACCGVVLDSGAEIRAKHVIVAAGSGTRALCQGAGLEVPVHTVKAECFVTEPLQPFLNNYYSSAGFFAEAHSPDAAAASLCIAQSMHGNLLIAETTKPSKLYRSEYADLTSPEHCARISALACRYFPALKRVQVLRSWVTQSPYTPSCLPVFGPSGRKGLFLAAGFKSAAVMSKLVGELTRDYFEGKELPYDLSEFTGQIQKN